MERIKVINPEKIRGTKAKVRVVASQPNPEGPDIAPPPLKVVVTAITFTEPEPGTASSP